MIPNTIVVLTPALPEARVFYRDVLGFPLAHDLGDHLVFALEGDAEMHVFETDDAAPRADHGAFAATHIVFEVPDLDAKITELSAKGVRFLHNPPAQNRFMRYAAFRAPGGNVHELCERLPPRDFRNV